MSGLVPGIDSQQRITANQAGNTHLDLLDAFLYFSQPRAVGCNAFPVGRGRGCQTRQVGGERRRPVRVKRGAQALANMSCPCLWRRWSRFFRL